MSQTNDAASCCSMESGTRERKLTEKALLNKIEKLQNERKRVVDKIKGLIPQMKELMKQKEDVSQVKKCFGNLNTLCEKATLSHNELMPLLPDDELIKQKEWFSSIVNYSNTFQKDTQKWIVEIEQKSSQELQDSPKIPLLSVEMNEANETEDDIRPSDSVSNVGSHKTSSSRCSSTYSARLVAEAELAALAMRHKLLKEKHALEEEEQRLRKRREELKVNTEIAEKMAQLEILKTKSTTSGKRTSKVSDGMKSYLEKAETQQLLNVNADEFIPKQTETNTNQNTTSYEQNQMQFHMSPLNTQDSQGQQGFNTVDLETNNNILGIMRKQNDITTLLMQQQCLSALPKREIPIYDGDPLKYHSFIKAFENGVERNTTNSCDRLYFLEQHTKGHTKELVRSCQPINSNRGYAKAKALLREQFGNEQKIASAYMDKALSWPPIKAEDIKALQDYSLFLRGCCNAMEDVQYLLDMDMPSNMLSIIKKLPYKLRDKWRNRACDLQEQHNRRAKFTDIADFIERQVKIMTDPVFGNIQDSQTITYGGTNKPKPQFHSGNKGSSFATTVGPLENKHQSARKEKEIKQMGRKACICCGGGHTLDVCVQMGRMPHERKIGFLKENGICFGCLCTGHISRDCRKRISCSRCSLKHPTVLHKEPVDESEQTERSPELRVNNTVVSSGLTGAGDQDCKLPIVPVQVKSNKGTKIIITYAFLDQGSTAVFCTESLMHKLHLIGRKGRILLRTMGHEKVVSSNIVSGLEVAALEGDNFLELPRVYTQESMPVNRGNIPTEKDIEQWSYLKDIHLPQIDAGIELLTGTNVPKALEPLEVVCSVNDGPYAICTLLGWTVNGPLTGNSGDSVHWDHPQITVNRVSVVNLDDLWQQQMKNDFPESISDEQTAMSKKEPEDEEEEELGSVAKNEVEVPEVMVVKEELEGPELSVMTGCGQTTTKPEALSPQLPSEGQNDEATKGCEEANPDTRQNMLPSKSSRFRSRSRSSSASSHREEKNVKPEQKRPSRNHHSRSKSRSRSRSRSSADRKRASDRRKRLKARRSSSGSPDCRRRKTEVGGRSQVKRAQRSRSKERRRTWSPSDGSHSESSERSRRNRRRLRSRDRRRSRSSSEERSRRRKHRRDSRERYSPKERKRSKESKDRRRGRSWSRSRSRSLSRSRDRRKDRKWSQSSSRSKDRGRSRSKERRRARSRSRERRTEGRSSQSSRSPAIRSSQVQADVQNPTAAGG